MTPKPKCEYCGKEHRYCKYCTPEAMYICPRCGGTGVMFCCEKAMDAKIAMDRSIGNYFTKKRDYPTNKTVMKVQRRRRKAYDAALQQLKG